MGRGYSDDLRVRVIRCVDAGMSRRATARLLDIGEATAVRWVERWTETGSVSAKPGTGHSRSPLKAYEEWLLRLIAETPDLTLEEVQSTLLAMQGHKAGIGSIWRFYDRHGISFKKKRAGNGAGPP